MREGEYDVENMSLSRIMIPAFLSKGIRSGRLCIPECELFQSLDQYIHRLICEA